MEFLHIWSRPKGSDEKGPNEVPPLVTVAFRDAVMRHCDGVSVAVASGHAAAGWSVAPASAACVLNVSSALPSTAAALTSVMTLDTPASR
jgi:hypothetical protein